MAAAPIAPITGMLKKNFFVHVGLALTGGYAAGMYMWVYHHDAFVQKRAC